MRNVFTIPQPKLWGRLKGAARGFAIGGGTLLLVTWLALFGFPVNSAAAENIGGYDINVNEGGTTCTITGHPADIDNLNIPGTLSTYTVTSIGSSAFSGRDCLISVTIPDSVTSIGEFAFDECSNLTSLTLEPGTEPMTIGRYAFYGTGLTEVTIPDKVTDIREYAFSAIEEYPNISSLSSVTLGSGIKTIGPDAFMGAIFTSVTIPDNVTDIGDKAFAYCSELTGINIPTNVTSIGNGAFLGCTKLLDINVSSANLNYTSVDGVLFDITKNILVEYPGGKTGHYIVPAGVTSIGANAYRRHRLQMSP